MYSQQQHEDKTVARKRKEYATPEINVYGDLRQITLQNSGSKNADGHPGPVAANKTS